MAKFVILTKLSAPGRRQLLHDAGSLPDLSEELSGVDAKIVEQYALLGTHDFLTVVDVPVPLDAFKLSIADRGAEGVVRSIFPAMDLPLFVRLIGQTTETVGPHRWQTRLPARCSVRAPQAGSRTSRRRLAGCALRAAARSAPARRLPLRAQACRATPLPSQPRLAVEGSRAA